MLTGVNTNFVGATINGGTLSISADANLGNATESLTFGGGTLNTTATFSSTRAVTLNTGTDAFNVAAGTTLTESGLFSGTGGLTMATGSGTLVLSDSNNSYSGGTTLNAGTLSISSNSDLGSTSGAITFGGGTLNTTATFSSSRAVTLNTGTNTFNVATGTTFNEHGSIFGTGGLTLATGTGTLVLNDPSNTYSGGTTIDSGTLSISSDSDLGNASGALTLGGGTLAVSAGNISSSRAITLNSGTNTFSVAGGQTLTESGVIKGTGGLTLATGTGTLFLSNTGNTYSGGTTLNAGTLSISSDANLGNSSGGLTIGGGTLDATATMSSSRAVALNTGTNTFNVSSGATLTENGLVSGTGGLTMATGTGTLVLGDSSNSYSGGTTIDSGTLQIASNGDLGNSNSVAGVTLGGGTLSITAASLSTNRVITLNAGTDTLNFSSGASLNVQNTITGAGMLDITGGGGTGGLKMTNVNGYTGGTTIGAGALLLPAVTNAIPSSGTVTDNGTLDLIGTASQTIGALSGSGVVDAISGTPTLTISGNGTFGGQFQNTGGTLSVVIASTSGIGQTLSGTDVFSGTITDNGSLTVTNPNALQNSTLNMGFAPSGSVYAYFNAGTSPETYNVAAIEGGSDYAANLEFGTSGTLVVGSNNASTDILGSLLGGTFEKVGTGTLGLYTFSNELGDLSINGGTVQVESDILIGSSSTIVTLNGGTLAMTATTSGTRNFTVGASGGALNIANGTTYSVTGQMSGTGSLDITGGGGFSLSGSVSGLSNLNITTGGAVSLNGGISGPTNVSITGGANVSMTGNNNYTGTTTINSGTLLTSGGTGMGNIYVTNTNAATATLTTIFDWGNIGLGQGASVTLTGAASNHLALLSPSFGTIIGTAGNNNTVTFGNYSELEDQPTLGLPFSLTINGVLNTSSPLSTLSLSEPQGYTGAGRQVVLNYTGGILTGSNSAANGGFGSVTGLPAGFYLEMTGNATTAGEIDMVQHEIIGTITATPQSATVFAGASDPVTFTVANSAYSGGDSLNFSTSNGSNISGSASGSVAANSTSSATSGLAFSSSTAGANQTGSFTVNDPNSVNSGQAGNVTVSVVDHALVPNQILTPQVTQGQTVNFNYALSNPTNGSAFRDGAVVTGVSADGNGYSSGYSGTTTIGSGASSSNFTGSFTSAYGAGEPGFRFHLRRSGQLSRGQQQQSNRDADGYAAGESAGRSRGQRQQRAGRRAAAYSRHKLRVGRFHDLCHR